MGEVAKKQMQMEWSEFGEEQRTVGKVYSKVKWSNFLETAKEGGFECGFKGTFERQSRKCETVMVQEEEVILYNKDTGIVLYAESVDGEFLAQATISCEIEGTFSTLNSLQKHFFERATTIERGDTGIGFSMHVRRDIKETLEEIQKLFRLVPVWDTQLVPNCLNYAERKNLKRGRNLLKLKKCTQGVKAIIFK